MKRCLFALVFLVLAVLGMAQPAPLTRGQARTMFPWIVGSQRSWVPIGGGRSQGNESGPSNGSITECLTTFPYYPEVSGQGIIVEYWNFGSNGVTANGWGENTSSFATMTLACGAFSGSTFLQGYVYGTGATTATVNPGGVVWFVIPGFDVRPGTAVNVQTGMSIPSGDFPRWWTNLYHSSVDAITNSMGPTNIGTAQSAGGSGSPYGPSCVYTIPAGTTPQASVLIRGDSIAAGAWDTGSTFNTAGYNSPGYLSRGLTGLGIPERRVTLPSEAAQYQLFPYWSRRDAAMTGVTHCIWQLGTNDAASLTAAQMETNAIAEATEMVNRGIKVGVCTLTPRADGATSSTYWAQTNAQVSGNQTASTHAAVIDAYNAWARTCPNPFSFVIDACPYLRESGSSVDTWTNGGKVISAGVVTSGTTTSVISTALTGTSGQYLYNVIHWTKLNGTTPQASDAWRQISTHSGGSGTATWSASSPITQSGNGALSVSPVAGDTFDVWQSYTIDGLHPTPAGNAAATAAVQAGMFTTISIPPPPDWFTEAFPSEEDPLDCLLKEFVLVR